MGSIQPVAAPAAEAVVVLGGTVAAVAVLGLWQVEVEDGVLLAAGLVGAAEVVEAGVDRLWSMSSGGGTGSTTGEELEGSLFTSRTSMGPAELFRWIWYFFCPLTC